jgi:hypothetical protein
LNKLIGLDPLANIFLMNKTKISIIGSITGALDELKQATVRRVAAATAQSVMSLQTPPGVIPLLSETLRKKLLILLTTLLLFCLALLFFSGRYHSGWPYACNMARQFWRGVEKLHIDNL